MEKHRCKTRPKKTRTHTHTLTKGPLSVNVCYQSMKVINVHIVTVDGFMTLKNIGSQHKLIARRCLKHSFALHPSSLHPANKDTKNTYTTHCCRRSSSLTLAAPLIIFPDHFQHCMPVPTSCFKGIHFLSNTKQSLWQTCGK